MDNQDYLLKILEEGKETSKHLAYQTMKKVYHKVGFVSEQNK